MALTLPMLSLCARLPAMHVADDLHVAVAVRAKTGAGRNAVFVDDAQVAPGHVRRVVVPGKGKAVKGLEPAVIGIAAVLGFAQRQHGASTLRQEGLQRGWPHGAGHAI